MHTSCSSSHPWGCATRGCASLVVHYIIIIACALSAGITRGPHQKTKPPATRTLSLWYDSMMRAITRMVEWRTHKQQNNDAYYFDYFQFLHTSYIPLLFSSSAPKRGEKYIICPLIYLISPLSKKKGA